ncbi:SET domain-containing protein-lysine N-methyltransferase [Akkermansiaceae bacterium]|mgnify:FL=1|nr:SET domain-containing protein-lysine N-methyltransferase [Akkermansiaceae bacterium]|tara:strand:- start:2453 stop:3028 length:576 start_codon:yes stop_codon:yes gene_type:complete
MGKNKKKDRKHSEDKQKRRIEKLRRRGESDFVEVRGSVIHGQGVYCIEPIEKEQYFIEYVGNRVSKEESEKRALKQFEEHEKSGAAAVYIFNLTKKWDLDGNVEWNPARLINHSCNPNSEAIQDGKRIFIQALRDIGVDEEITFDYGFEVDCYEDHPCRCGSSNCIGYIVGRDYHNDLADRLAAKETSDVS